MIELKKFTDQEEFALRMDLDGIYLLGMTELLWKLVSMLENNPDLSEELKGKIESLKGKVENENIGLDDANKAYKKLKVDVENFWYEKKVEMELKSILDLKKILKDRFKNALNDCLSAENFEKMSRLCEIFNKVTLLVDLFQERSISLKAIMNLSKLTFDNEILDNLIIQATMSNKEFASSSIYLKNNLGADEEADFAVLVHENDKYFMVSYNSDGSVKFKEFVRLVAIKYDYVDGNREIVESVIKADDHRDYVSIDKIFNEKNWWKYKASLWMFNTKVINEKMGLQYLIVGNYNNHHICLQDGILSIRLSKRTPDEKGMTLNYEDPDIVTLDSDTLVKMVEAQLSSLINQDELKRCRVAPESKKNSE